MVLGVGRLELFKDEPHEPATAADGTEQRDLRQVRPDHLLSRHTHRVAPAECQLFGHHERPANSVHASERPTRGEAEMIRVRVEIMESQKCRIVGESQSVLIMINPIISTRTRICRGGCRR
jgi:hypothetical protein